MIASILFSIRDARTWTKLKPRTVFRAQEYLRNSGTKLDSDKLQTLVSARIFHPVLC